MSQWSIAKPHTFTDTGDWVAAYNTSHHFTSLQFYLQTYNNVSTVLKNYFEAVKLYFVL